MLRHEAAFDYPVMDQVRERKVTSRPAEATGQSPFQSTDILSRNQAYGGHFKRSMLL